MCGNTPAMSGHDIDEIFGATNTSEFDIAGMELRYDIECGEIGETEYSRCRIYRDKEGDYYMAVKGFGYSMFVPEVDYPYDDREMCIPCTSEALYEWSRGLVREEYDRATEEFNRSTDDWGTKIWEYHGPPYEFLVRTDAGSYRLYSTEYTYPCIGKFSFHVDENEFARECTQSYLNDMCCYLVTSEVARRWAEARGMGEQARQRIFG